MRGWDSEIPNPFVLGLPSPSRLQAFNPLSPTHATLPCPKHILTKMFLVTILLCAFSGWKGARTESDWGPLGMTSILTGTHTQWGQMCVHRERGGHDGDQTGCPGSLTPTDTGSERNPAPALLTPSPGAHPSGSPPASEGQVQTCLHRRLFELAYSRPLSSVQALQQDPNILLH